jgi:hypothetical protein
MARTGLIIDPGAGYAQLAAPDGTIRFDTRHQIFHVLSKLSGSLSRPAYSSSAGVPRTANIALGTVDPNCTAVLGLARFNGPFGGDYGFELTSGRWYAVGGTIVLNLERWRNMSGEHVGDYVSACALASFVLVGNTVRYQEELAQKHASSTTEYGAFTVTYRLYCGTFT